MKRLLKIFGLGFLLLIVVVVGGASWLMGTERGFQQTLALAKKFAPGTLAWDEADGKLIGPLNIRGLHYSQPDGIDANVGSFDFDWQPGALFGAALVVDQLHVDNVEVRLAEAAESQPEEPAGEFELPDISMPASINLNDIAITSVAIYPAGQDTPIVIDRVGLEASMKGSDVRLASLEVIAPQGELHLAGDVQTSDEYPMNLALNWKADIGQSDLLQGEGTVAGSLAQLQIDHKVSGFATADIAAAVSDVVKAPAWDATIEASLPEPGSVSPLLTDTPKVLVKTSGTPDAYQAQATVNVTTTDTGPVTLDADVSGSTESLDINSLVTKLIDNGGELSATGKVDFASLQSDIRGQWQTLSWPVQGEPQFSSGQGSFDFSGTPDNFTANVGTDVQGEAIPDGQWTVAVEGSSTALSNFAVQGQTLDGTIDVSGTAAWENQPEWDVKLVTQGINPGAQWAELPGSINLDISSTGQINDDGPQLVADINDLSGSFRKQPLSGGGSVRLAGNTVNIDELTLAHGPATIDANGEIDDQLALDFDISSPDLSSLLPDLSGEISIAGNVSGTQKAPQLNASGSASDVSFTGNSVSALNFSIDAALAPDAVSSVSVDATGIEAGGQRISDFKLNGDGTQTDHSLVLSAQTNQGDFATQLNGGYQENTWTGALSSLLLEDTPGGTWRLRDAVEISANAEKADTSQLCLDNSDNYGSLCITADWLAAGESTVTATISGLSPQLASAYMPPGFDVQTALNGDITAVLGANGAMNADVALGLDAGKFVLDGDPAPIEIGLEPTTIDASLRGTDITVDLATAFTDLGELNVQASIADPGGAGRLAGTLNADFPDLTLISAFAPQVQQVTGVLKSDLSFGGSLQAPQIEGELSLLDFSAEIPETAMLIKNTQLTIKGNPDGTLTINGDTSSGDGQLTIQGNINPGTKALELNISGDDYQVANTAVMQAVVSPQLDIAMDDTGMTVNGEVTIPSTYINANGGNEGIKTVNSSSDVVFVSDEGEEPEAPPSNLNLDVQIILGDSVEVEAGDFRGRLEGDLRVQQTPELAPLGTGTINVVNGDYVIYGQQLDMERGRILFSGGPVDNPTLDMEVARTVQEYEVVAGAKILGTAQSPRLELYSEPSMPDASILSFILVGQPPGSTSLSYTLGKYLTPELYVSYGIGLFDAINTFNMRYSLTETLAVEAASGVGSSADIIYTIER